MKKECHLRLNLRLELKHNPLQNRSNEKLGVKNRKHNSCLSILMSNFFSGAIAKVRKATIIFVMSVCPSVRMEQLGSHSKHFH